NRRAAGFPAAFLRISPLRTLIRSPVCVAARERCGARDVHSDERSSRNILAHIEIHSLLLPAGNQPVTADLYARGSHDQQPAARINRWNPPARGVVRVGQFVTVAYET